MTRLRWVLAFCPKESEFPVGPRVARVSKVEVAFSFADPVEIPGYIGFKMADKGLRYGVRDLGRYEFLKFINPEAPKPQNLRRKPYMRAQTPKDLQQKLNAVVQTRR